MLMYKCDKCGRMHPTNAFMCKACGSLLTIDGHTPIIAYDFKESDKLKLKCILIGTIAAIIGLFSLHKINK